MFDLSKKRALVTGASGGIGRQIAKALSASGAQVALSGTRVAVLEQLSKEISGPAHVLPCDLSDLDQVDRLVPQAMEAMGGIDILVNNAGLTRDNLFMRLRNEDWDQVIAVNLTAAFRLSRAVLRPMIETALWPPDRHFLGCRGGRQRRAGQLCRLQGRADRHVEIPGSGSCLAQHYR